METAVISSPIGLLHITGDDEGVKEVTFLTDNQPISTIIPDSLSTCVAQLSEYFDGKREDFDLKLNPQGTEFQRKVWEILLEIPFSKTRSYLEQSKVFGDVKAIRAVASANGKNPIVIIIPCHRVIGSDGSLTGYAGGKWRKQWLLNHESPSKQQSLF
ncbi:MAG: methylated-DNA--[protein]-cysteine S-methyltransferase [Polaribacter sp.]